MASALSLKRLVSSYLLPKSIFAVRSTAPAVQSASRLFNTNAARDFDDDDRSLDADSSSNRSVSSGREFPPNSFTDAFDPFSRTRSLSQILNAMMDQLESPLLSAFSGTGGNLRRGWDARETEDGLYLRMDMPGLGKEDVRVSVEQNTLIIKGENGGEKEKGEEEIERRRFTSRIDLPEKLYKTNEIKAEMKNGVLKLMVPKVKEEERSDVIHVAVQ